MSDHRKKFHTPFKHSYMHTSMKEKQSRIFTSITPSRMGIRDIKIEGEVEEDAASLATTEDSQAAAAQPYFSLLGTPSRSLTRMLRIHQPHATVPPVHLSRLSFTGEDKDKEGNRGHAEATGAAAMIAAPVLTRRELEAVLESNFFSLPTRDQELVTDTLHWLSVAQETLRFLSHQREVSVEAILKDLGLPQSAVLYSVEEGDFSSC